MEQFASGWKRNYYGKGDVIAYRLNRDGVTADEQTPVFGASVKMLLYGDAFWPTYTAGDNTGLIATDSMKNFIQCETLNYTSPDLESYCHFLASKFLGIYPQVEGLQICATEIPHAALQRGSATFAPAGPECCTARLERNRAGTVEITSGIQGFRLLRLGGSAFHGFVRDEYTTLPDIKNRPLRMGLDLEWSYTSPDAAFSGGKIPGSVRATVHQVFEGFESGSIQEVIYKIGTRMLTEIPAIAEVHLEAKTAPGILWLSAARNWESIPTRAPRMAAWGCVCEDSSTGINGSLVYARSRHCPRHPGEGGED